MNLMPEAKKEEGIESQDEGPPLAWNSSHPLPKIVKITVCGGGNGAHTIVPIATRNLGCLVDIYAPFDNEAEQLSSGEIETTGAVQARARPHCSSSNPENVIPGSQLVVLILPAFAHQDTLRQIVPYLDQGAWVGAIPARGGFDYCGQHVLRQHGREDVVLFGLQTLPWACRIQEYGRKVHVLGVKNVVDAASRPAARIGEIVPVLEGMLGLRVQAAANLLALTLSNTGQLIHPGIMYAHFHDWDGVPFSESQIPPFYHGLDEKGARVLVELSDEIQAIRLKLDRYLNLDAVRPLKTWLLRSYGNAISDSSTLRNAFITNHAYHGLMAPVREIASGQYIPDFGARYLAEDVPYGLVPSRAIANLAGVQTPMIDRVIRWAGAKLERDFLGRDADQTRIPANYGLVSLDQMLEFMGEVNRCAVV